MDIRYS